MTTERGLSGKEEQSPPGVLLQVTAGLKNIEKVKVTQLCLILCDPMDYTFMEFSRPEYWSGFPSLGDLPSPGIEPRSPALQADSLSSEPPGKPKMGLLNI